MGDAAAAVPGMPRPPADRFRLSRRALLSLFAVGGVAACGGEDGEGADIEPSGTPAARRDVASDAYIFGYPLVLIDTIRRQALQYTRPNRFQHTTALPTSGQRTVVRVDLDNLYSVAWLDLRKEPVLFEVPRIARRRWAMQILDAWSNTAFTPTSLQPQAAPTDSDTYLYAVTGPGWQGSLPDGAVRLPVPTADAWLYGRIQVRGPRDVAAVRDVQSRLRLAPLSAWTTPAAAESDTVPENLNWSETAGLDSIGKMPARDFFDRMGELMQDNPPVAADEPAMRRFATIGIRPGGSPRGVSTGELAAGVDAAKRKIDAFVDPGSTLRNGWVLSLDVGRYGTNYLLRAATAHRGVGANLAAVVVYAALFDHADDRGDPIEYTLRFGPGQAPPVAAFWSLTAYGSDGFLVPNEAELHTVGHPVPPVYAPDGSLEIALQAADPGPSVPRSNWLPIPERGQFSLVMRLYEPEQQILDGEWVPPPLRP